MRKLLLILAACAVGVAFSLIATTRGQSSSVKLNDCSTLTVPANSDYNNAYDPESGELAIDYVDAAGNDATVTVDSHAASCKANRGVAKAIEHAVKAARDVVSGECASLEDVLNGGTAIPKGGRTIDLAAARQYVKNHCA